MRARPALRKDPGHWGTGFPYDVPAVPRPVLGDALVPELTRRYLRAALGD